MGSERQIVGTICPNEVATRENWLNFHESGDFNLLGVILQNYTPQKFNKDNFGNEL